MLGVIFGALMVLVPGCDGAGRVAGDAGMDVLDVAGDAWSELDALGDADASRPDGIDDSEDGEDGDAVGGDDAIAVHDGADVGDSASDAVEDSASDAVEDSASDTVGMDVPNGLDGRADVIEPVDTDEPDPVEDVGEDVGGEVVEPAPREPLVEYALGGDRTLYFLNNPEQLVSADLGDASLGDKTLYRVTARGRSRSFFEHVNKSGRTIGFGVQLYNPGPGAVDVQVSGVGWVVGLDGGVPFKQAEAGAGATSVSILAGKSTWILRKDDAVPNGSFFSGVVDYDVQGGPVIVNHIAYDAFAGLDGSTSELGYVQRVEPDGTHEARMYKGVASASEAVFEAGWVIDDRDVGALAVRTRRWDTASGQWREAVVDDGWTTHIGPGQNAGATVTDMVSFALGEWRFDPLVASDGEGRFPNLGNWGVTYRVRFVVENRGTKTRRLSWRLAASPGAGAALASSGTATGAAWSAVKLAAGAEMTLVTAEVAAGASGVIEGRVVLGGPSGGALRQSLRAE